jgi:hypothetical protein
MCVEVEQLVPVAYLDKLQAAIEEKQMRMRSSETLPYSLLWVLVAAEM